MINDILHFFNLSPGVKDCVVRDEWYISIRMDTPLLEEAEVRIPEILEVKFEDRHGILVRPIARRHPRCTRAFGGHGCEGGAES